MRRGLAGLARVIYRFVVANPPRAFVLGWLEGFLLAFLVAGWLAKRQGLALIGGLGLLMFYAALFARLGKLPGGQTRP